MNLILHRPFKPWHMTREWGVIPIDPKTGESYYKPYGFLRHNGWDVVALEVGNPPKKKSHWPVFCPGEGLRVFATLNSPGGGKELDLISINELDLPTGRGYLGLVFMHNDHIFVKPGDVLALGEAMCVSDNTGTATTGEHVHMGVYRVNKYWQKLDKNDSAGSFNPALLFKETYALDLASVPTILLSYARYYKYLVGL